MNLLGVDFEDWYHPELVQRNIPQKKYTPTVIDGIDKILDFLRKNETFATFFVVGELLEYKPELLDKISDNGHEIAFHTMNHTRLSTVGFKEKFDEELMVFSRLTNGKSKGFRAPTFSLNHDTSWAIDVLAKNSYEYDSSVVPAKTSLYGIPNASRNPYRISSQSIDKNDPDGPKKIAAANEMLRGMLFTLSLNANKTFQVSVIQGKNSQKSEGTWKLVGNKVEMIDLKRDGKPVPKAEQEKSKGVFVLDKAAKSMSMNLPGAPAGIKLVFTKK